MENLDQKKDYKQGLLSALGCAFWWGIMPIYWQWLKPVDSMVIIFYRIFLVALVCFIAAKVKYSFKEIFEPLKDKKILIKYIIAGILITVNWSIYIWAVNADHVIQTCIGYYIEPLVVCAFGMIFFKEKLSKFRIIAICFALVGVISVVIYFHEVPIIALSIALSFSCYAAMKKDLHMPPVLSLFYETIFLAPFALAIIFYIEFTGQGALVSSTGLVYFLLMFCGLFTALPLVLFANATNKVSLVVLGLTEYISPTISLIISIFYFKEPFEPIQLIAFIIIWIGLVFFTIGEYKDYKANI